MSDPERHELAEMFRLFARTMARDANVTYERICLGIADDPWLLDLMATAPSEQRRPNLLLAAVHYLLLGGLDHPLAEHYPTVVDFRRRPSDPSPEPPVDGDPGTEELVALFADLCRRRAAELEGLLATRATQTNEVGRCSALLPALATVAAGAGRPLAVLDLGASAGLNLLFDRYAYDYRTADRGSHRTAGDPASTVRLMAEVRSGSLPPLATPHVAWRRGLDQRPIDPADPDGARWLLGCLWPDDLARFRRLRAALGIARSVPGLAPVERGDVLDDLARVVADVPDECHLCLVHTWMAAYLSPEEQAALAGAVAETSTRRRVSWLFAEQPYEVPGLPVPPAPEGQGSKSATALVLADVDGGELRLARLADMHPHGTWLRWWAEPPGAAPA